MMYWKLYSLSQNEFEAPWQFPTYGQHYFYEPQVLYLPTKLRDSYSDSQ